MRTFDFLNIVQQEIMIITGSCLNFASVCWKTKINAQST